MHMLTGMSILDYDLYGGFQILYIHRNFVNVKHWISFIARSVLHSRR